MSYRSIVHDIEGLPGMCVAVRWYVMLGLKEVVEREGGSEVRCGKVS